MERFGDSLETVPVWFCEYPQGKDGACQGQVLKARVFSLMTKFDEFSLMNLPLGFVSSLFVRNPNAEDRVCRPRVPLSNIRPVAHLPSGADPPGKCVGANNKVLDGVKAEGETLEGSYLDPSHIEMLFLNLSHSYMLAFAHITLFSSTHFLN